MTHRARLLPPEILNTGSAGKAIASKRFNVLGEAIARHAGCELASFHTPGHKGRMPPGDLSLLRDYPWQADLTELPGLDDLSCPQGVLADLEKRAAAIWGAGESIISVNGASAALAATMIALAARGSTVLVPRNAHRSIIHGLVLSGLFPLWYEPVWDGDWGLWGAVTAASVERLLARHGSGLAGLVVVAPTYAGAMSDIRAIAGLCRASGVALVVDEAHGAHFVPGSAMPPAAADCADVVVHSLHKTLPALTQTGLLHAGRNSLLPCGALRSALRLLQSSSPSYLLMASIEQALSQVEGGAGEEVLARLHLLGCQICSAIQDIPNLQLYQPASGFDPAHILAGFTGCEPDQLYEFLCERGIFPEAVLGHGVLFMLGLGTTEADAHLLTEALADFAHLKADEPAGDFTGLHCPGPARRPAEPVQILSPRQAFLMPSQVVPVDQAIGRICAETFAPCPPGTPVVVPGQRVPEEILECAGLKTVKVVSE